MHYKVYKSGSNYEIFEYEDLPTGEGLAEFQTEKNMLAVIKAKHSKMVLRLEEWQADGMGAIELLQRIKKSKNLNDLEKRVLCRYFNSLELKNEKVELDQKTKDKRRVQTLRDNANNMKRMVREHFSGKAFMITLTYSDKYFLGVNDIDKSDRRFKSFWKKLKDAGYEVKYCGVRELQQRGAIHGHFIVESEKLYDEYIASGAKIKNKRKNDAHKEFQNEFEKKLFQKTK